MPLRINRPLWNLRPRKWVSCLLGSALLVGCSASEKNLWYLGDRELSHYKDTTTAIEYSDVNEETADEVSYTDEPRRIRHTRKDPIWSISLEETIHTALANNEILRDNQQSGFRLLNSPDVVPSIYDVALQESNQLFAGGGVEAALSEFDAQLTASLNWGRSEQISESIGLNGIDPGDTVVNKATDFRSNLAKIFGDGGRFEVQHNVLYQHFNGDLGVGNSRMFRDFFTNNPSAFQGGGSPGVQFEYARPLWAGAGTAFTRTAGPILSPGRRFQSQVPAVNQGVVLARIRTDIAVAEFESSVINLVKDTEDSYWELYLAYRRFDADMVARDSSLRTWREVKNKMDKGIEGGGAADEAQARGSYYELRARSEESQANLYEAEGRLRRLMGLPVNDGRVLRPSDEPTTAEFHPDWRSSLVEALSRRIELRKQKWNIKNYDLQLDAAKSLTHPRLDFVSRYQVNGFGDDLFENTNIPGARVQDSFYGNLFAGNQTGWGLGVEFSMPLGFRAAHTQVRNIELRLAKAKAALGAIEHEISHELATAFRQLDSGFQGALTNFNRRNAEQRRLQAYEAQYTTGRANVDLLLRSQISLAQAETAYYQSLVAYNRAITNLKFRKGTLLDDSRIFLSESLSHPESYGQALRRAWARSYGLNAKHLKTEPPEFVNGASDPVEMGTGPLPTGVAPQQLPLRAEPARPVPPVNQYEEAPGPDPQRQTPESAAETSEPSTSPSDKPTLDPKPDSKPETNEPPDAKEKLMPPEPTAQFQLDDGFRTTGAEDEVEPPPGPKIQQMIHRR